MHDYSVTFACYNNSEYTKKCIESLRASNFNMSRLVVVDNASSDDTVEYLESQNDIKIIKNKDNMGCGVAWNQGIMHFQSEWTVIMNNDILVSRNWIENLIDQTIEKGLLVSSPSMIEGDLNYNVYDTLAENESKAFDYYRKNSAHAVCLLVHKSVWKAVGLFRATPKLLGFEDTIFFFECFKNNIPHGLMGRSWIHHFGSITVKYIKKELGVSKRSGGLGDRSNKNLLDQGFFMRKIRKFRKKQQQKVSRKYELLNYGLSLHIVRNEGDVLIRC